LKKQLKMSRPIELIDLSNANDIEEGTSSSEEGSNPCEPPSKRHLEEANELTGQQTLATDIWQGRFDEVFELARAAGVDANRLFEIRNRPLSSGS
jgi:hypothetical protein